MRLIASLAFVISIIIPAAVNASTTYIHTHFVSEYGVSYQANGYESPEYKTLQTVAGTGQQNFVYSWGLLQMYDVPSYNSPLIWGRDPAEDNSVTKFEAEFIFSRSFSTGDYPDTRYENSILGSFSRDISIYYIADDGWRPTNVVMDDPKYVPQLTIDSAYLLSSKTIFFDETQNSLYVTFNLLETGLYNNFWLSSDKTDRAISLAMLIGPSTGGALGWSTPLFDDPYVEYEVRMNVTSHPTAATPEPGTMLLMGIGAAGAAFMRRRKTRIAR